MHTGVVISKPHHLINALNLLQQKNISDRLVFVISNTFFGADSLYHRIAILKGSGYEFEVIFIERRLEAYLVLRKYELSMLLIDTDVGFKHFLYLSWLKLKYPSLFIVLYEEGWGPYYLMVEPKIKRQIFRLLGIGAHFGGCIHTNQIYLYNSIEYQENFPRYADKAIKYTLKYDEFLANNFVMLCNLFDIDNSMFCAKSNNNCVVYLSDKIFDTSLLPDFSKMDADRYIKFHPGCVGALHDDNWLEIRRDIPSELIITKLLIQYEQVTVYHHFSSATRYINGNDITYIDLGKQSVKLNNE